MKHSLFLLVALLLAACAAQEPPAASLPAALTGTVEREVPVVPVVPLQLQGELVQGALVQGALVQGRLPPGSRLRLGERDVRLAPDGTFVFGLDRDAPAELVLAAVLPDGTPWQETRPVRAREYDIQKVSGIARRIMEPTAQDLERIRQEGAQVSAARRTDDPRLDFLQPFSWPLVGRITGVYGSQRYYNDVPGRPHYGIDIAAPTGTPVLAPASGIVTLAHADMFYSGGTLIIDHGHGVSSTLMHLSAVLVKAGERVEQGQVVARVGATGRSSGPHLDWRMNWFGERIDPQLLVPPMPASPGGSAP